MSPDTFIHNALVSCFVHTSLFMVCHKLRWPWHRSCAVPSLFHATVTCSLATYRSLPIIFAMSDETLDWSSLLGEDSWYPFLGSFSVGYMLYDVLEMLINDKATPSALIHHVLVIVTNLVVYAYSLTQPIMVLAYVEELSTIILNLPAVLNLSKSGRAYPILKVIFFLSFIASRFSIMWSVLFQIPRLWSELNRDIDLLLIPSTTIVPFLLLCLGLAAMRLVNCYWLALIIRRIALPDAGKAKQ